MVDYHLEKDLATHSRILAWKIPWTEEPGGLQSMGSQRVGHDCLTHRISLSLLQLDSQKCKVSKCLPPVVASPQDDPCDPCFLLFHPLGEASCSVVRILLQCRGEAHVTGKSEDFCQQPAKNLVSFNSHVREPSWQWIPQPMSSLQTTAALPDSFTATSRETDPPPN